MRGRQGAASNRSRPIVEERSASYGWVRRALYGGGGPAGAALRGIGAPLGWVWRRAAVRRLDAVAGSSVRLSAPTISVGNVVVGGGGKTSLVQWLLAEGLPEGLVAAVLSRGYGREGKSARVLAPGDRDAAAREAGDEAALLARSGAWVGVASDRRHAAEALARSIRPDCFVLDDGLQHRGVARALDLVAFTAEDLSAPARCLPAGPLRQGWEWRPPAAAWVVIGCDPRSIPWPPDTIGAAFRAWWCDLPGTEADWRDAGTVDLAAWWAGLERPFEPGGAEIVAFAGVARPESVGRFAVRSGHAVERVVAFPDHHGYGPADIRRLLARHPEASFLTTEKDAVKLDPEWFAERRIGVLRRRVVPREADLLRELIREAIAWPR